MAPISLGFVVSPTIQIAIYRVIDGKIAEVWEEADFMGLMQQLESQ